MKKVLYIVLLCEPLKMEVISWLKLDTFINCDIEDFFSKMRPPNSQTKKGGGKYGRSGEGRRENINEDTLLEGTSTINSLHLDAELKRFGPNWMLDFL